MTPANVWLLINIPEFYLNWPDFIFLHRIKCYGANGAPSEHCESIYKSNLGMNSEESEEQFKRMIIMGLVEEIYIKRQRFFLLSRIGRIIQENDERR